MKYGIADVMCPTKRGEAVCTDCATTWSSKKRVWSETKVGSSGDL